MEQQLPPPIKDAAHNYATHNYFASTEIGVSKISFEAGAEWQKEQYKELLHLSWQIIDAYHIRYPDADQLLVGYSQEELFKKLLKLRESLQD